MTTRVRDGSTSQTAITGTHRYKYFKRPIMPKINAVPPQVLLAPTSAENPLVPMEIKSEPNVKDVEVQTQYRESEAQTIPYTPAFIVPSGEDPEILLLKNLNYENGLPVGKKEIDMIEYVRAKRELDINLPPFTDEASLSLRKRLMELQELKEFKLREAEIDHRRDEKLEVLERALAEREESNEFMISQRLETVRLLRMEERERVLQKIRNKRIKALRRLAHQRNAADPVLSEGTGRDIINDYFDRGSSVYAPSKRDGKNPTTNPEKNEVNSRTLPLNSIGNILSLEYTIPKNLLQHAETVSPTHLSKSAPAAFKMKIVGGGRAAEPRLTSAAQRSLRMTKRDVEEMHQILMKQRQQNTDQDPHAVTGVGSIASGAGTGASYGSTGLPQQSGLSMTDLMEQPPGTSQSGKKNNILTSLLAKKPKGRPPTPDFTEDRNNVFKKPEVVKEVTDDDEDIEEESQQVEEVEEEDFTSRRDQEFQASVILLQRLIRGRAVQNIMFEGKYRRRELIQELQNADAAKKMLEESDASQVDREEQMERNKNLRESTVEAAVGGAATNILQTLAQEQARINACESMQAFALEAIASRRKLEAGESGRRQKEGLTYPAK